MPLSHFSGPGHPCSLFRRASACKCCDKRCLVLIHTTDPSGPSGSPGCCGRTRTRWTVPGRPGPGPGRRTEPSHGRVVQAGAERGVTRGVIADRTEESGVVLHVDAEGRRPLAGCRTDPASGFARASPCRTCRSRRARRPAIACEGQQVGVGNSVVRVAHHGATRRGIGPLSGDLQPAPLHGQLRFTQVQRGLTLLDRQETGAARPVDVPSLVLRLPLLRRPSSARRQHDRRAIGGRRVLDSDTQPGGGVLELPGRQASTCSPAEPLQLCTAKAEPAVLAAG